MKLEYKLKPITENSWILQQNGNRLAMIISTESGLNVIGDFKYKHFTSMNDMIEKLDGAVSFDDIEKSIELEIGEVFGYPIKHGVAYDTTMEQFPSYAKTENSTNRFAAGYYGILFANGWVASYCPKVSTIKDNEWIGPFHTRLEMLSAISFKKKEPKI